MLHLQSIPVVTAKSITESASAVRVSRQDEHNKQCVLSLQLESPCESSSIKTGMWYLALDILHLHLLLSLSLKLDPALSHSCKPLGFSSHKKGRTFSPTIVLAPALQRSESNTWVLKIGKPKMKPCIIFIYSYIKK